MSLPSGFKLNTGRLPPEARGKRVEVILRDGSHCGKEPISMGGQVGWAADDRQGCRWSHLPLTNPASRFDIMGYKVL